jgi:hypothetical protein
MPTFYAEDIDIDADEFLSYCNDRDREELIDALIKGGYLKKDCKEDFKDYNYSVSEAHFVEAVDKLKNKWNMLTQEEEELIIKIANRF